VAKGLATQAGAKMKKKKKISPSGYICTFFDCELYIMTRKNKIGSNLLIEEILGIVQHGFLLRKVEIL
jgi:hypothetical protein